MVVTEYHDYQNYIAHNLMFPLRAMEEYCTKSHNNA
jgi:hypothetical protein